MLTRFDSARRTARPPGTCAEPGSLARWFHALLGRCRRGEMRIRLAVQSLFSVVRYVFTPNAVAHASVSLSAHRRCVSGRCGRQPPRKTHTPALSICSCPASRHVANRCRATGVHRAPHVSRWTRWSSDWTCRVRSRLARTFAETAEQRHCPDRMAI